VNEARDRQTVRSKSGKAGVEAASCARTPEPTGSSGSFGATEDRYNSGDNLADGFRVQYTSYTLHQSAARREEFTRPRIARDLQRTSLRIPGLQHNRGTVGIGFAGHLTQNPVTATGIGQHYSRAEFGL
jgi:hypothetical protein